MAFLAFCLIVFSVYAGRLPVPMAAPWVTALIMEVFLLVHIGLEHAKGYYRFRNLTYYGCTREYPNTEGKAFWFDLVSNGFIMTALNILGVAVHPFFHLALGLYIVVDLTIHVDMKWKHGGTPEGWETSGLLVASALFIFVTNWPTIIAEPIGSAVSMALGGLPLSINYAQETIRARIRRGPSDGGKDGNGRNAAALRAVNS